MYFQVNENADFSIQMNKCFFHLEENTSFHLNEKVHVIEKGHIVFEQMSELPDTYVKIDSSHLFQNCVAQILHLLHIYVACLPYVRAFVAHSSDAKLCSQEFHITIA